MGTWVTFFVVVKYSLKKCPRSVNNFRTNYFFVILGILKGLRPSRRVPSCPVVPRRRRRRRPLSVRPVVRPVVVVRPLSVRPSRRPSRRPPRRRPSSVRSSTFVPSLSVLCPFVPSSV